MGLSYIIRVHMLAVRAQLVVLQDQVLCQHSPRVASYSSKRMKGEVDVHQIQIKAVAKHTSA